MFASVSASAQTVPEHHLFVELYQPHRGRVPVLYPLVELWGYEGYEQTASPQERVPVPAYPAPGASLTGRRGEYTIRTGELQVFDRNWFLELRNDRLVAIDPRLDDGAAYPFEFVEALPVEAVPFDPHSVDVLTRDPSGALARSRLVLPEVDRGTRLQYLRVLSFHALNRAERIASNCGELPGGGLPEWCLGATSWSDFKHSPLQFYVGENDPEFGEPSGQWVNWGHQRLLAPVYYGNDAGQSGVMYHEYAHSLHHAVAGVAEADAGIELYPYAFKRGLHWGSYKESWAHTFSSVMMSFVNTGGLEHYTPGQRYREHYESEYLGQTHPQYRNIPIWGGVMRDLAWELGWKEMMQLVIGTFRCYAPQPPDGDWSPWDKSPDKRFWTEGEESFLGCLAAASNKRSEDQGAEPSLFEISRAVARHSDYFPEDPGHPGAMFEAADPASADPGDWRGDWQDDFSDHLFNAAWIDAAPRLGGAAWVTRSGEEGGPAASFDYDGDRDAFAFTARQGLSYRVQVDLLDEGPIFTLRLLDASGAVLAATSNHGDGATSLSLEHEASATGTLYIAVEHDRTNPLYPEERNRYLLLLKRIDDDHSDDPLGATDIAPAAVWPPVTNESYHGSLDRSGDIDFFRLGTGVGSLNPIQVELEITEHDLEDGRDDLVIDLYSVDLPGGVPTLIASSSPGDEVLPVAIAPVDQRDFFLASVSSASGATGEYRVAWRRDPEQPRSPVLRVSLDAAPELAATTTQTYPTHWYRFDGEPDRHYSIETSLGLDARICVFSPDHPELVFEHVGQGYIVCDEGSALAEGGSRISFVPPVAGKYPVLVTGRTRVDPATGQETTSTGPYRLRFIRHEPAVGRVPLLPDFDDVDGDGVPNETDVCPGVPDPGQEDLDGDGRGSACEEHDDVFNPDQRDRDGDGVPDAVDPCPDDPGVISALDADGDGLGAPCDPDDQDPDSDVDGDGIPDAVDSCIWAADPTAADTDGDGIGDACDEDRDNDTIANQHDNCDLAANARQADLDADGSGDACDPDLDNDGWPNNVDSCLLCFSSGYDRDRDGRGDECDWDDDGDGVTDFGDLDLTTDWRKEHTCQPQDPGAAPCKSGITTLCADNCRTVKNPDQDDCDSDGSGNACDAPDENGLLVTRPCVNVDTPRQGFFFDFSEDEDGDLRYGRNGVAIAFRAWGYAPQDPAGPSQVWAHACGGCEATGYLEPEVKCDPLGCNRLGNPGAVNPRTGRYVIQYHAIDWSGCPAARRKNGTCEEPIPVQVQVNDEVRNSNEAGWLWTGSPALADSTKTPVAGRDAYPMLLRMSPPLTDPATGAFINSVYRETLLFVPGQEPMYPYFILQHILPHPDELIASLKLPWDFPSLLLDWGYGVPGAGQSFTATFETSQDLLDQVLVLAGESLASPDDAIDTVHYGAARVQAETGEQLTFVLHGEDVHGTPSEGFWISAGDGPWQRLELAGEAPPPSTGIGLVYSPGSQRLLTYGGRTAEGLSSELWALDLETMRWSRLPVPADAPALAYYSSVVDNGKWYMVGGISELGPVASVLVYDMQSGELSLLSLDWSVPGRFGASVVLDADRDELQVFGGNQGLGLKLEVRYEADVEPEEARQPWVRDGEGWSWLHQGAAVIQDDNTYGNGFALFHFVPGLDLARQEHLEARMLVADHDLNGVCPGVGFGLTDSRGVGFVLIEQDGVRGIMPWTDEYLEMSSAPAGWPVHPVDWTEYHRYEIDWDRTAGVVVLRVDGEEALSLPETLFPEKIFDDGSGLPESLGVVMFGTGGGPAWAVSAWDYLRYSWSGEGQYLNDLWSVDLGTGEWTERAPLCEGAGCAQASAFSAGVLDAERDELVLLGGVPRPGQALPLVRRVDLATGTERVVQEQIRVGPGMGDCDGDGRREPLFGRLCTAGEHAWDPLGYAVCDGGRLSCDAGPVAAEVVDEYRSRSPVERFTVAGDRLVLATEQGLTVVDVSDPSHPREERSVKLGPCFAVQVPGDAALLGCQSGLVSVDLETGRVLDRVGDDRFVRGIALFDGKALVAGRRDLKLIDISDPEDLTEVWRVSGAVRWASDAGVLGAWAWVADRDGLRVFDLGAADGPTEVGFAATHQALAGCVLRGETLYCLSGNGNPKRPVAIDVGVPSTPFVLGEHTLGSLVEGREELGEEYLVVRGEQRRYELIIVRPHKE